MTHSDPTPHTKTPDLEDACIGLAEGRYEHLDLGSGRGGAIHYAEKRFGATRSLGVELLPREAEVARRNGYDVVTGDAAELVPPQKCVSYVTMIDFLEHLPDAATAERVLARAGEAARDFLFIRHPSFEDGPALARYGFKMAWTELRCHPNPMRIAEFNDIFRRFGWRDVRIVRRRPIVDSRHEKMLPLDAPRNVVHYDPEKHGSKRYVRFRRPFVGQFDIWVRLGDIEDARWDSIVATSSIGDPGVPEALWRRLFIRPTSRRAAR